MAEEPLGYGWLFDPPLTQSRGERTLSVRMDITRLGSQVVATALFIAAFFIASDPRLLGTQDPKKYLSTALKGLWRQLKLGLLCAALTFFPFWAWIGFSPYRDTLGPILPWWVMVYLATWIACCLAAAKRGEGSALPKSEDTPIQPRIMQLVWWILLLGGALGALVLLMIVANLKAMPLNEH